MNKSGGSRGSWPGWKKKRPDSVEARRALIEHDHPTLSISRQCEVVSLARSTFYYEPAQASPENLALMRLIDEQYLRTPFYGYAKMTAHLCQLGYPVNEKRIYRLMRLMGIQAVYARPRPTLAAPGHKVYPYLLRGLVIRRPNQVWSADITYVPRPVGFMYLVVVVDWFSRYVLAWQLSNTLDTIFCLLALRQALNLAQPDIFNTDQGVQFPSQEFTGCLEATGVRVSMDGRGRALDNVFIERLWRTVKYEDLYLKEYTTVPELAAGLMSYFDFYNTARPHQALAYRVPADVHFGC